MENDSCHLMAEHYLDFTVEHNQLASRIGQDTIILFYANSITSQWVVFQIAHGSRREVGTLWAGIINVMLCYQSNKGEGTK